MTAPERLTIHLLSDSIGEMAEQVAKAAAAQFAHGLFVIERLPPVASIDDLAELVARHCGQSCIFFYTFADASLRDEMKRVSALLNANSVDILGPAVDLLSRAAALTPSGERGAFRRMDAEYFARFDAIDFALKHDDGQHPEGLAQADIVIFGISRTGKTPLSMYLAFKGYRTANVPLVPGSDPPEEIYLVERRKLFGLTTDPLVLARVRRERMHEMRTIVRGYADMRDIEGELEESRALMRRLGCMMIRTDNRAIEESAAEILRYLEPVVEEGADGRIDRG